MPLDHLTLLTADVAAFASAVEHGPPDALVAGCPGWTLKDLAVHLGTVHRWVIDALVIGGPPDGSVTHPPAASDESAALAEWVREGAARMIVLLEETDPGDPTWHPFPIEPKVAGLWRRRQSHEASLHRWDAQHAAGMDAHIDRALAVDGIDEYFHVMLPRMLTREPRTTPSSTFAVQLTDVDTRWALDGSTRLPVPLASEAAAQGTLCGNAEAVLLRLWGRPGAEPLDHGGDGAVIDDWLALGGA
jgi:uncharacterized protein (TIGR03083 family)